MKQKTTLFSCASIREETDMRQIVAGVLFGTAVGFAGITRALAGDIYCPASDGSGIGPGEEVDNVKVVAGSACVIMGATVNGNIQTDETGAILEILAAPGGPDGFIPTIVKGDIQVVEADSVSISDAEVDGNIQIEKSAGAGIVVSDSVVAGDVQLKDNDASFITVLTNTTDGNIQAEDNTASGAGGINISSNNAGGDIQAFGNFPSPIPSSDNVADGHVGGQASDTVTCPCFNELPSNWMQTSGTGLGGSGSCPEGSAVELNEFGSITDTDDTLGVSLTTAFNKPCDGSVSYSCRVSPGGSTIPLSEEQFDVCNGPLP